MSQFGANLTQFGVHPAIPSVCRVPVRAVISPELARQTFGVISILNQVLEFISILDISRKLPDILSYIFPYLWKWNTELWQIDWIK